MPSVVPRIPRNSESCSENVFSLGGLVFFFGGGGVEWFSVKAPCKQKGSAGTATRILLDPYEELPPEI